jgi:hypothetical protein
MIQSLNSERDARLNIDEEAEYEGDSDDKEDLNGTERSEFVRRITNDDSD